MVWLLSVADIIGAVGMGFLFTGFVLIELDYISDNTYTFNILNIAGSSILLWYSYQLESMIFFALNAIWIIIAVVKIIKLSISKKKSF